MAVLAKTIAAQLAHVAPDVAVLAAEVAQPIAASAAVAACGEFGRAEDLRQHDEPERIEGEILLGCKD